MGYPKRLTMGFVFIAIVASMVASLFFVDRFRGYQSEMDIVILPKSAQGAMSIEAARDILMLLGSKPDFLSTVNEVADADEIMFTATGKGSLRLSVVSTDPIDARDAASAASRELFGEVGRYYDIRSDIEVRSLGSSRTEVFVAQPILLALSGIGTGILFSFVFFLLVLSFARVKFSLRREASVQTSVPERVFIPEKKIESEEPQYTVSPDAFVPKKIDAKFFSFEPTGASREKDYAHFNRGPAPTNLPVALDESEPLPEFLVAMGMNTPDREESKLASEPVRDEETFVIEDTPMIEDTPVSELPIDHEPTAEEYKKRLNDLLKGKMP